MQDRLLKQFCRLMKKNMCIFYSVFNQALLEALTCKPLVEFFSFSFFKQKQGNPHCGEKRKTWLSNISAHEWQP
jgi:hypothetical protein